jgi:putative transposase
MPYSKLYYHFVWGTKRRLALIEPSFEPELYRVIAAKVKELEGFTHAIGGTQDHVHVTVSLPPKIAPAKFAGDAKGSSSHFVNHVVRPGFEFYWQAEYGVLTFGEKNLPGVVRYIQNQKRHHAEGTLIAALEQENPR